jgi:hypothetical protein
MSMEGGSYSEQEAQEILRRAASLQTSGSMSAEEMVRAAAELGISREAVEQAEAELRSDKLDKELLGEFRRQERGSFMSSMGGTLVVMAVALWFLQGVVSPQWVAVGIAFFCFKLFSNISKHLWERSSSWQRRFQTWKAAEIRRRDPGVRKSNEEIIASLVNLANPESKLSLIRELRTRSGISLKEAKDAVDDYYKRHPEVRINISS